MQVVWFKRDLRVSDHRPLVQACGRGYVVGLYVYEPEVIAARDFDPSHLQFINESLRELREAFRRRGGLLLVRHGAAAEVLEELSRQHGIDGLWSHEETGTLLTYSRDQAVGRWAREQGVPWTEIPQNGVVRVLKTRDGWADRWHARMREDVTPPPVDIRSPSGLEEGRILDGNELGIGDSRRTYVQKGGETLAAQTIESFLEKRGKNYRTDMSSPLSGELGCSRISPYLAWGNISIRQVWHATQERVSELKQRKAAGESVDGAWLPSLSSFRSRLRWHCHFIQKLEDQPNIEHVNICRAYDGMREEDFDEERFAAWKEARTGYPMVDACMLALQHTGWINFRMRAMLMSFTAYHLWLHWQPVADHLSCLFLDYEPGIHYSQAQMQAGVTGINTVRIYSPAKQVRDQDPHGQFIRRYLPQLQDVPDEYLPEPHTMPPILQKEIGCVIGEDYPAPIVDHRTAYQEARERIYEVRAREDTKKAAERVYLKHGSRKRPRRRRAKA